MFFSSTKRCVVIKYVPFFINLLIDLQNKTKSNLCNYVNMYFIERKCLFWGWICIYVEYTVICTAVFFSIFFLKIKKSFQWLCVFVYNIHNFSYKNHYVKESTYKWLLYFYFTWVVFFTVECLVIQYNATD